MNFLKYDRKAYIMAFIGAIMYFTTDGFILPAISEYIGYDIQTAAHVGMIASAIYILHKNNGFYDEEEFREEDED